jgi:hypothetical protein
VALHALGCREVAKHRIFTWMHVSVLPGHVLIAFARCDDTTFGILQRRLHVLWWLRLGTALDDRPWYTPTTSFDTYPFPYGLTPAATASKQVQPTTKGALIPAGLAPGAVANATAVADAAKRLYDLREPWLNLPEWTEWTPDIVPLGRTISLYAQRATARPETKDEAAKRTLTKLYNDLPPWLQSAHQQLDKAVAEAYGWTDYTPAMTAIEVRTRLLKLNLSRVGVPA